LPRLYQQQQAQQAQPQPQKVVVEEVQPKLANHYVLPTVQNTNILNSKFSTNFNAKPRGFMSANSNQSQVYG